MNLETLHKETCVDKLLAADNAVDIAKYTHTHKWPPRWHSADISTKVISYANSVHLSKFDEIQINIFWKKPEIGPQGVPLGMG